MIATFTPEKLKVIVFDVDDTVTRGTLGIKVQVFKDLFSDRPARLQEARELYEFTGKGDRFNIIAHTLEQEQEGCHGNPLVQKYARKFEMMTQEAIRKHGVHADDVAALIAVKQTLQLPIYLLSATPQASVDGNIQYFIGQGVFPDGMFTKIIGNPMHNKKAGELKIIAEENSCSISEVLMVGDGGSDYRGAFDSGSQFVAIVPQGKEDAWPNESFPKIESLSNMVDLFLI